MHEHEHDHDHAHHCHPHSHEHSGAKPMSPDEVQALLNYMHVPGKLKKVDLMSNVILIERC